MANYKETNVVGTEYTRCNGIRIVNPYNLTPSISFSEERATVLGERTLFEQQGELTMSFNPDKTIPLINPLTGEPTGNTVTFGDAYAILFSAYMDAAQVRDNLQEVPLE